MSFRLVLGGRNALLDCLDGRFLIVLGGLLRLGSGLLGWGGSRRQTWGEVVERCGKVLTRKRTMSKWSAKLGWPGLYSSRAYRGRGRPISVRSLVTECATWADICVSFALKTAVLTMKSKSNDDDLYIFRKLREFSIRFNNQIKTILYNNFDRIAFLHDFLETVKKYSWFLFFYKFITM